MKRRVAAFVLLAIFCALLPQIADAQTVLQVGSSGTNVTRVQQRLIAWGYMKGSATGYFGTATRDAVRWFQRNNNLAVDGRVGPATAARMGITLASAGSSSTGSTAIISADHRLLSRLVYGEARGESYKGQVAVAAVVLNRVRSSQFPNTISGVIYQKGAFSCVNDGSINRTPYDENIRAARDALNGWDPSGGALYFFNPRGTSDQWIRTRRVVTVIGNHRFAV
ncbi:MAG: spore cortex-lytic enzyme [Christensenellales bacterium]|jgi:N-acetylmuramoyl-L-alanine amidase